MIWGETIEQYQARTWVWRPWFAWRPVGLPDGRTAWLESVERKRHRYGPVTELSDGVCWIYRLPE